MRVLIFTHKSDIDGMGSVVLSKLAFKETDYVLCETFNLANEFKAYYDLDKIYDYDMVYVTDLCLEEPFLSIISEDELLKNKFMVFDHHKSSVDINNNYDFVHVRIDDEKGMCSGTSLFYEYLGKHRLLSNTKEIEGFVELTRRYDTWEWKNKYNDEMAHELTLLFNAVGPDGYIKLMYDKLSNYGKNEFQYNELERMLIDNKKSQSSKKLSFYANKMVYKNVNDFRAGIVFIDYEYRNDLAEYLRENNVNIDFLMMVALEYGTISYRNIKDGIKVRRIAESFGGKGHDYAASSPINGAQKEEIIKVLTKKK